MTVQELRDSLNGVDGNLIVVIPGSGCNEQDEVPAKMALIETLDEHEPGCYQAKNAYRCAIKPTAVFHIC